MELAYVNMCVSLQACCAKVLIISHKDSLVVKNEVQPAQSLCMSGEYYQKVLPYSRYTGVSNRWVASMTSILLAPRRWA